MERIRSPAEQWRNFGNFQEAAPTPLEPTNTNENLTEDPAAHAPGLRAEIVIKTDKVFIGITIWVAVLGLLAALLQASKSNK